MQPSASFEYLREQIVGVDSTFTTPFGERLMVYCDYTASGRCLLFVENYLQSLQRTYANTHTEDDTTGRNMTQLLHEAESFDQSLRQRRARRTHHRDRHRRNRRDQQTAADSRRVLPAGHARADRRRTRRVHRCGRQARVRSAPARAAAGGVRRSVRAPLQRSVVARRIRDGRRSSPRRRRRRSISRTSKRCCATPDTNRGSASARSRRPRTSPASARPCTRSRDCCTHTTRSRVSTTPRARRTYRST